MSDSTVQVNSNVAEAVGGQAQAKDSAIKPHDGRYSVDETVVHTDRVILDANADDAVQVPEDCGASTVGHASPLRLAYEQGTPEEQFAKSAKDEKKSK